MGKTFLFLLMLAVSAGIGAPAFAQPPAAPASAFAQAPADRAVSAQPPAEQPSGQVPLPAGTVTRGACGRPLPAPSVTPPPNTTFIWVWELCFPSQATPEEPNGLTNIEPETYLYYVKFDELISRPKEGVWSPWNDAAEEVAIADFKSLMQDTTFLEDLRIERTEFTFPNGAVGIIVSYIGEERERVKIVDYRDSKREPINLIKRSNIDEKLRA